MKWSTASNPANPHKQDPDRAATKLMHILEKEKVCVLRPLTPLEREALLAMGLYNPSTDAFTCCGHLTNESRKCKCPLQDRTVAFGWMELSRVICGGDTNQQQVYQLAKSFMCTHKHKDNEKECTRFLNELVPILVQCREVMVSAAGQQRGVEHPKVECQMMDVEMVDV